MALKNLKIRVGVVVSDKMDKTRVVKIERIVAHPLYLKRVKKHKKIYVHDPENKSKLGDKVKVVESRPISKLKRWVLLEILERAK